MELTKEQLDQIKGVISETLKANNTEMVKDIDARITQAVSPITSRVEQMEGKINEASKTPTPTGDPLNKGGDGGGGGDGFKDVLASIKTLSEKVDTVVNERDEERTRRAARALVDEVVGKKYPNLKGKQAVMDKLYAAQPKDEAALDALVEAEKKYAEALGLDGKAFGAASASPESESGKPGNGSDGASEEEKNKARADEIRKRREAKSAR